MTKAADYIGSYTLVLQGKESFGQMSSCWSARCFNLIRGR